MGATDPIPIGCTAIKPVERHGLEAIKWFLYDKETAITSAALNPVTSQPHTVDIFLIVVRGQKYEGRTSWQWHYAFKYAPAAEVTTACRTRAPSWAAPPCRGC